METGDFVKGKPESTDAAINGAMSRGLIVGTGGGNIRVRILDHDGGVEGIYAVPPEFLEVTGRVRPFSRSEVMGLLRGGRKKAVFDYDLSRAVLRYAVLRYAVLRYAVLRYAVLRYAVLRHADLDFSCLPLKCEGLEWRIDKRIACQIAYHFCSMRCGDAEFIRLRNLLLPFANRFHRVGECGVGVLEPLEEKNGGGGFKNEV